MLLEPISYYVRVMNMAHALIFRTFGVVLIRLHPITFTEALKKVWAIGDEKDKVKILCEIAVSQAQIGDTSASQSTFIQARERGELIEFDRGKPWELIVVEAEIRAGDVVAALATAKHIEYFQAEALRMIVKKLVKTGTWILALEIAQQIENEEKRMLALGEIAVMQTQIGYIKRAQIIFDLAKKAAQQIKDKDLQIRALVAIANAKVQAGDPKGGLTILESAIKTVPEIEVTYPEVDDAFVRIRALVAIANAKVQAGDPKGGLTTLESAIETVQEIEAADNQAWSLVEIAEVQGLAGDPKGGLTTLKSAHKIAQQIKAWHQRDSLLRGIAVAQAQAMNWTVAIEIAGQITERAKLVETMIEIVEAQTKTGEFARAIKIAKLFGDEKEQAEALQKIALAQAQTGDTRGAIETTKQIENEKARTEVFTKIAQSQVNTGFFEDALRTVEMILVDRNDHIPIIAAAFAEKNYKEYFKRLLLPCAYYFDAAYEMCGHLARLYPGQAKAIAEILLKTENHLQ
ncbi:MAG: hypothetical protein GY801_14590 [bacterium]|nr:hypothetical protein [bacterium]